MLLVSISSLTGQGFDIEKETIVMKSGERIGASEIGLLATVGIMTVKVPIKLFGASLSLFSSFF